MKIALIAMSGIRVCDQELLNMGLTLPGFVERSKVIASLPSLGLLTLAGMTPSRHHLAYIEVDRLTAEDGIRQQLDSCDLIAISSYSAQIGEAYALADELRQAGKQVVIGGIHATTLPAEAKEHCDAVLVGEGELSWSAVLRDAEAGALQPYYKTEGAEFDLQDAPMPAFELLDIGRYNRLTVQTSRGCPHRCAFCASSILLTKQYKQKPAARVLAEIDRIKALWEHPFIEFADDNTFVNKAYWKELLPELKKRNIRWFTETDVSLAQDGELLHLMRESGCAQVLIGFESPTAPALQELETRRNWKYRQQAGYREAIATIQSHGISVNGCFVLGLDSHDQTIFDQVYDFVMDSGLHEVQITLQTPFPGTPLYAALHRENRIISPNTWEKCTLFDINFVPRRMTVAELSQGFKRLTARLYSEEATKARRAHFKGQLRALVKQKGATGSPR